MFDGQNVSPQPGLYRDKMTGDDFCVTSIDEERGMVEGVRSDLGPWSARISALAEFYERIADA